MATYSGFTHLISFPCDIRGLKCDQMNDTEELVLDISICPPSVWEKATIRVIQHLRHRTLVSSLTPLAHPKSPLSVLCIPSPFTLVHQPVSLLPKVLASILPLRESVSLTFG